jgi:hypothetical protein
MDFFGMTVVALSSLTFIHPIFLERPSFDVFVIQIFTKHSASFHFRFEEETITFSLYIVVRARHKSHLQRFILIPADLYK